MHNLRGMALVVVVFGGLLSSILRLGRTNGPLAPQMSRSRRAVHAVIVAVMLAALVVWFGARR